MYGDYLVKKWGEQTKKDSGPGSGLGQMTVLSAGVIVANYIEFERGGKNSLAAFQPFRVNQIVHAEPASLSDDQSN
jgi:hypothetical protein